MTDAPNSDSLRLSIVVPAHNEEANIAPTLEQLRDTLIQANIPYEIVVVDDDSQDGTAAEVEKIVAEDTRVRLEQKGPPCGLGRAVRHGITKSTGDVIAIVMADLSDDPKDVVRCYRKIEEGFDCVFGTRFHPESKVSDYPAMKLLFNRIANRVMQMLFMTPHNDLTNAFKMYRRHVVESITPLHASHFNITIEMSLSALVRQYKIASIPINWSGRTWGQSKLKVTEMGRRYLCTMLKIWFERLLILDDLMAENKADTEPWSRR